MTIYDTCDCTEECPNQWLFLGASVTSFSSAHGWGETASTLTVELAEDTEPTCDDRVKKYIDDKFVTQDYTDPDPGFFGTQQEIIGVPVLFKFEDFEFAGLVSDWEQREGTDGKNLFTVTVEAPTLLLSATQVVIDAYTGSVNSVPNVINAFGLFEGTSCSTFGDSENFGRGMPWNNVLAAIAVLTSAINPAPANLDYLQSNRLKYRPGLPGGFGLVKEDDTGYLLDTSELPLAPDYYRMGGDSINLLDAINQVANDSIMDWFAELTPCCYEGSVYKIIKIRTVDRTVPPVPNAVDDFITTYNNSYCGVSSWSKGKEQRDGVLHSIVVGGPVQYIQETTWARTTDKITTNECIFTGDTVTESVTRTQLIPGVVVGTTVEIEVTGTINVPVCSNIDIDRYDLSDDLIAPYWGLDVNGDVIMSTGIDYYASIPSEAEGTDAPVFFPANSWALNDKFFSLTAPTSIVLSEGELMAAQAGFDAWESYIQQESTETFVLFSASDELYNQTSGAGLHNLNHIIQGIKNNANGYGQFLKPFHMLALRKVSNRDALADAVQKDKQILFNWVLDYANEYYGTQFMVRIPDVCVVQDPETLQFILSNEPSDGGWPESLTSILGIDLDSADMDFFRLEDGRISTFCRFNSANLLNFEGLSPDDYGYYDNGNGYLYLRCTIDPGIVFGDRSTLSDPRVVIRLPQVIGIKESNLFLERDGSLHSLTRGSNKLWAREAQQQWVENVVKSTGSVSKIKYAPERPAQPDGICVPLINNTATYGPWIATNGLSVGGVVNYEVDASLVPWNFGGHTLLDTVGNSQATLGVSTMFFAETGTITTPGIPKGRPGDELLSINGSGYVSGQFTANTRQVTVNNGLSGVQYITVNLIAGPGRWVGTLGPIVTNMTISVTPGTSGMTTTYNVTSYRKKFRRFSKVNLNRFKEIGQLRQDILKNI